MNQTNPQNLFPNSHKDILVHQGDAGVTMTVKTNGETVWLTQEQMCQLFGRERSVITKHIRNIFKEGELDEKSNVQNLHIASGSAVWSVALMPLRTTSGISRKAWTTSSRKSPLPTNRRAAESDSVRTRTTCRASRMRSFEKWKGSSTHHAK